MTDAPDYDAIEALGAAATPGSPDFSHFAVQKYKAALHDLAPALIARCRELEAKVAGIEHANDIAAAHRFDLDPSGSEQELVDRLARLGEKRKGGPDNFYNGVQFATTRVRRAILDSKDPT